MAPRPDTLAPRSPDGYPDIDRATLDRIRSRFDVLLQCVPIGTGRYRDKGIRRPHISDGLKEEVLQRQGGRCFVCDTPLKPLGFDIHHTDYHNTDDPSTLRALCFPCHGDVGILTRILIHFGRQWGMVVDDDSRKVRGRDGRVAWQYRLPDDRGPYQPRLRM